MKSVFLFYITSPTTAPRTPESSIISHLHLHLSRYWFLLVVQHLWVCRIPPPSSSFLVKSSWHPILFLLSPPFRVCWLITINLYWCSLPVAGSNIRASCSVHSTLTFLCLLKTECTYRSLFLFPHSYSCPYEMPIFLFAHCAITLTLQYYERSLFFRLYCLSLSTSSLFFLGPFPVASASLPTLCICTWRFFVSGMYRYERSN